MMRFNTDLFMLEHRDSASGNFYLPSSQKTDRPEREYTKVTHSKHNKNERRKLALFLVGPGSSKLQPK